MGTSVTSGSARGLVIATGAHTLFGAVAVKLAEKREETSFDKGVKSFTWLMIRFMVVLVAAVFLIVGITKGKWLEALLFALSVAVGLTPEMLPMIVTVNLAKGALLMAKRKVIIKKLPSIQNLGAINILCTDKTGTLTQDRVVLEHHVDIIGNKSEEVLNYAYLNGYFQTGLRNLLDRAVLEHVDLDVEECKLIDELPFDFQRRRMSVVVEYEGDNVLICKGAVEEIYSCCSQYQIDEEIYPLIDMIRADLFEEVEKLNREGFRVLGIAYRGIPHRQEHLHGQGREPAHPPGLHRLHGSSQGIGDGGHPAPFESWCRREGSHRRQRSRHAEKSAAMWASMPPTSSRAPSSPSFSPRNSPKRRANAKSS